MRTLAACLSAALLTVSQLATADHNSRFGDNTGRTVDGVHDDRFDTNTKSSDNADLMRSPQFGVRAEGGLGGYQQSGWPSTVTPGAPSSGGSGGHAIPGNAAGGLPAGGPGGGPAPSGGRGGR